MSGTHADCVGWDFEFRRVNIDLGSPEPLASGILLSTHVEMERFVYYLKILSRVGCGHLVE